MLSPRSLTGSLPRDRHLVRKRTRTGELFCLNGYRRCFANVSQPALDRGSVDSQLLSDLRN
jgi:hypothetical protein